MSANRSLRAALIFGASMIKDGVHIADRVSGGLRALQGFVQKKHRSRRLSIGGRLAETMLPISGAPIAPSNASVMACSSTSPSE